MTHYQNILLEEKEEVVVLTMNNPKSRNPFTEETQLEMHYALDEIENDQGIRALVITGKGATFCTGGDLRSMEREISPTEIKQTMLKAQQLLKKLIQLEKPVIAAENGDAYGMGCNLALAADFAIASDKARFCESFVRFGMTPDFGALYFLPRQIGPLKSKELVFLGNVIGAEEAEKIGLVYKVVSHHDLMKEVMGLAGKLASMPTSAIGRAKMVLNEAMDMTLSEVLDEEIKNQIYLSQTEDHREGIKAFLEKRKPKFRGA